jgi:MarR family transcriptional regulator, organic hydroperoxide resistance regulator
MADKTFSFEKAEDSSGFLLWQVTTLWQRGLKKALDKHDLTHAQFVLLASLMWLSRNDDTVTQIALSAHSKIDPMTTSTVLRTLQTKGFVTRREHDHDTRAKIIALTDKGVKTVKQAIKTVEGFDHTFFSMLAKKQKDFNALLLTLIKNNVFAE